jgi:hypothetical protein
MTNTPERAAGTTWREHDRYVTIAFDVLEVREAEEGVARREARVRRLEQELGDNVGELVEENRTDVKRVTGRDRE